jgi:hypothetical protein
VSTPCNETHGRCSMVHVTCCRSSRRGTHPLASLMYLTAMAQHEITKQVGSYRQHVGYVQLPGHLICLCTNPGSSNLLL